MGDIFCAKNDLFKELPFEVKYKTVEINQFYKYQVGQFQSEKAIASMRMTERNKNKNSLAG